MSDQPTWNNSIKNYFTAIDIEHMSGWFDLGDYQQVVENIEGIYRRVAIEKDMPPQADGGPWSDSKIEIFTTWKNNGCPEN